MVGLTVSRSLHTAVIGAGFVGPYHVDAVRRGGYADVTVLAGNDAAPLEVKASQLAIQYWTTDIGSVVCDPSLDVIHICTPNATHEDLGVAALETGHNVVLEKPLAVTREGAERLLRAALTADRHAAVAFTYRGYPMVRKARVLIREGEIGELRPVHGAYLQDWLLAATDWDWRVEPAEGGLSRAVESRTVVVGD
jgi:predicted dehydrogenase